MVAAIVLFFNADAMTTQPQLVPFSEFIKTFLGYKFYKQWQSEQSQGETITNKYGEYTCNSTIDCQKSPGSTRWVL